MSLPYTQMKLAVRLTDRAHSGAEAPLSERLGTYQNACATMQSLDAGDPDRTEDVLNIAWSLVEDGFPRGTDAVSLMNGITEAFFAVADSAAIPSPAQPRRPRRDA